MPQGDYLFCNRSALWVSNPDLVLQNWKLYDHTICMEYITETFLIVKPSDRCQRLYTAKAKKANKNIQNWKNFVRLVTDLRRELWRAQCDYAYGVIWSAYGAICSAYTDLPGLSLAEKKNDQLKIFSATFLPRNCWRVGNIRSRINSLDWFHFNVICMVDPQIWGFLLFMFLLRRAIGLHDWLVSCRFSMIGEKNRWTNQKICVQNDWVALLVQSQRKRNSVNGRFPVKILFK